MLSFGIKLAVGLATFCSHLTFSIVATLGLILAVLVPLASKMMKIIRFYESYSPFSDLAGKELSKSLSAFISRFGLGVG